MTMEHKAFIFDYDAFINELAETLKNALLKNESDELITFIEKNLPNLKDPYEEVIQQFRNALMKLYKF